MDVYKNIAFEHWAKRHKLSDSTLLESISEIEQGMFDANLGGYIYKKRLRLGNQGKSGSARTIIAFKKGDNAFFIYAFKKNTTANISSKELLALKKLAKEYLSYSEKELKQALKAGILFMVEKPHG